METSDCTRGVVREGRGGGTPLFLGSARAQRRGGTPSERRPSHGGESDAAIPRTGEIAILKSPTTWRLTIKVEGMGSAEPEINETAS